MKLVEEAVDWFKKRMSDSAFMLGILLVLGAIAGANGRTVIRETTKEQLEPVQRQVNEHEQKLAHHNEDLHQVELDFRDLYKSFTEGRPSRRLEQPWPGHEDGGAP